MKVVYETSLARELGINAALVLAYLKQKPTGCIAEWANDLCISTNRVGERLRELEARGYIQRIYNQGKRNAGRLQIIGVKVLK